MTNAGQYLIDQRHASADHQFEQSAKPPQMDSVGRTRVNGALTAEFITGE